MSLAFNKHSCDNTAEAPTVCTSDPRQWGVGRKALPSPQNTHRSWARPSLTWSRTKAELWGKFSKKGDRDTHREIHAKKMINPPWEEEQIKDLVEVWFGVLQGTWEGRAEYSVMTKVRGGCVGKESGMRGWPDRKCTGESWEQQ